MVRLSRKAIWILSISIILVLTIFTITYVILINQPKGYAGHGPIIIQKDEDFDYYGFPGKGTKEEPYLIQNYNITVETDSITVTGTTKYFIIRNCFLKSTIVIDNIAANTVSITGNQIEECFTGIRISNTKGVSIDSNEINTAYWVGYVIGPPPSECVSLQSCEESIITNNKLSQLFARNSPNLLVENNTFSYNIDISDSSFSTIQNNTVYSLGISISKSESCLISKNFIFDSNLGIYDECNNSVISENSIVNGGYHLRSTTLFVENNLINNKELGFFVDKHNLQFIQPIFGQIIFLKCSNISVSNQQITNTNVGIYLESSNNMTISESELAHLNTGIYAYRVNDSNIFNNEISDNYGGAYFWEPEGDGIYLDYCNNINIIGNYLYNNSESIGYDDTSELTINNNNIIDNEYPLYMEDSPNLIVTNNIFQGTGLNIAGLGMVNDITLDTFMSFTIQNNTFEGKLIGHFFGIDNILINSENYAYLLIINCKNVLVSNQIFIDVDFGLYVNYCENITLENSFIEGRIYGVIIKNSMECNLSNNTVLAYIGYKSYSGRAVYLTNSTDCSFIRNTINSYDGIRISIHSSDIFIFNNTITDCMYYITVSESSSITILNNKFESIHRPTSFGIYFYYAIDIYVLNNSFEGMGTGINNFNPAYNIVISNNKFNTNNYGVRIEDTTSLTVSNNIFYSATAIDCRDIYYSVISNNSIFSSTRPISVINSINCTVSDNLCIDNENGILISHGSQCTITNNTVMNSNNYGLSLSYVESSTISNNTFSYNGLVGILAQNATNCIFTFNFLEENNLYGIWLEDCQNNALYYNAFINNNQLADSQAYDNTEFNTWYDILTSNGNYWSGWNSGLGPYSIDGTGSAEDLFPLDSNPL